MPTSIAALHPQVVHFVVALLIVGVLFRVVALTGRLEWTGPAATTLLVIGGAATWLAVESGDAAHGPAERIPGVRDAVEEHEEWGERTRNLFLGVAGLELLALVLRGGGARLVRTVSGLAGLAGIYVLYEAAEHGGALVYSYAGGVGVRTGNPEDVRRLLTAGLYHESQAARQSGRSEDANRLIQLMIDRNPADATTRLLWAESLLLDRKDPAAALAALDSLTVRADDARLRPRRDMLSADALRASGRMDSARTLLTAAAAQFPANVRLKAKLDSIR
ncbi:MAG: hypothetical protein K0S86_1803 [Geminicoccaceae bacterium]|jgi:uncharacterized membrane protein|nr:hypothetical protein [Geminicoccaceae bacterium]